MDEKTVNIQLVEDEKAHVRLIQRAFDSRAGPVSLTVAGTLQEARARLAESPPDLLIADLVLPDGKGTDFLPADEEECSLPIVLMTCRGTEQVAVEAIKAGALDYVVKSEATLRDMPHIAERALHQWKQIIERKWSEEVTLLQRDLSIGLNNATRLKDALRLCLDAAIEVSKMDCGGIYLVDEDSGDLDLACHTGLSPEFTNAGSHFDADSANARLVMAAKPHYTRHGRLATLPDPVIRREGLRALAIIPILHRSKVIVCLNIASHARDDFPAACRSALETISAQMGSTIARLKAEEGLLFKEDVIESSSSVIGTCDLEWNMTYGNPSFLKGWGFDDPKEFLGTPF